MEGAKTGVKEGGDISETGASEVLDSSADDAKIRAFDEYQKLPAPIKRRVRALKKLQFETIKIDAEFYKELFELEVKYDAAHQNVFEKRKEVITGSREPADEDCDWPSDGETDEVENLTDNVKEKVTVSSDNKSERAVADDSKGIPEFWLKTMRNVPILANMIEPHDVEILQHLTDIKCILNSGEESGFTLEFHFSPNKYFTNTVLTKRYFFNYDISPEEPFDYEGPEIVRAKGSTINWNPGKNVTVKLIKKVQKRRSGGAKRTITKTVQEDSFFNFFDTPPESRSVSLPNDMEEDTEILLETDFKIGQFIRESLIPRAVLYFTGEAVDSELDEEDEEDEDEDEEVEDDDDEDEKESPQHPHRGRHHRNAPPKRTGNADGAGEQPECKQQ